MMHDRVRLAKSKLTRLSSNDLSSLAQDIEYYFEQSRLFSRIKAKKTSEDFPCLRFACQISNPHQSPREVISAVQQIWRAESLGYRETLFEESTEAGNPVLDFLTVSETEFASGRILIIGLLTNSSGAA